MLKNNKILDRRTFIEQTTNQPEGERDEVSKIANEQRRSKSESA